MKIFPIALLWTTLGVGLAMARFDKFPTCSLTCYVSSIGGTGCAQTDIACICNSKDFINEALGCTFGSCSEEDVSKAVQATRDLCVGAGVDVELPGPTYAAVVSPTSVRVRSSTTTRYQSSTYRSSSSSEGKDFGGLGTGGFIGVLIVAGLIGMVAFSVGIVYLGAWCMDRREEREKIDPEILVVPVHNLADQDLKDLGVLAPGSDKPVVVDVPQRVHVYIERA
ncbi:hypothetical protein TWF281_009581 [Arthrobotrys megalospora]